MRLYLFTRLLQKVRTVISRPTVSLLINIPECVVAQSAATWFFLQLILQTKDYYIYMTPSGKVGLYSLAGVFTSCTSSHMSHTMYKVYGVR